MSEVTKKSCLLSWKPPADNGGHQITHYEVEKMDMAMGSWLPVKSINSMSLQVNNLVENHSYKFLVRAVNKLGDSPDLETEGETIARNPFDPPTPPSKPNVQDWGEDFAELSWKTPEEDGGAEISGYKVEVRNKDRRAWNNAGTAGGSETRYVQGDPNLNSPQQKYRLEQPNWEFSNFLATLILREIKFG